VDVALHLVIPSGSGRMTRHSSIGVSGPAHIAWKSSRRSGHSPRRPPRVIAAHLCQMLRARSGTIGLLQNWQFRSACALKSTRCPSNSDSKMGFTSSARASRKAAHTDWNSSSNASFGRPSHLGLLSSRPRVRWSRCMLMCLSHFLQVGRARLNDLLVKWSAQRSFPSFLPPTKMAIVRQWIWKVRSE